MKSPPTGSPVFRKLNPHLFTMSGSSTSEESCKLIRQSSKPMMNKLEQEFMEELIRQGYRYVSPQTLKFRLGNGVTYTPDFLCTDRFAMSTLLFEVKGKYVWDDAKVKIKVAAGMYPWMVWRVAWKKDGQWIYQLVHP